MNRSTLSHAGLFGKILLGCVSPTYSLDLATCDLRLASLKGRFQTVCKSKDNITRQLTVIAKENYASGRDTEINV